MNIFNWDEILIILPSEIKEVLKLCQNTQQTFKWHPEGNVLTHTKIVYNRACKTKNINFIIAAIFHDLGKPSVTKFVPPDKWPAHGHEFVSARYVEKHKEWIENMGCDYELVHYIVKNHMRAKQINEMRLTKREAFKNEKFFPEVEKFSSFDDMTIDYSKDL
jgi:hypothetical protein